MDKKEPLIIKCRTCEKEFNYWSSDSRPFCSKRCKMVDLGHWFNESYSVAYSPQTESEVEELISELEKNNENIED